MTQQEYNAALSKIQNQLVKDLDIISQKEVEALRQNRQMINNMNADLAEKIETYDRERRCKLMTADLKIISLRRQLIPSGSDPADLPEDLPADTHIYAQHFSED